MTSPRFNNLSINRKLTVIIIFSCLFVSLMASGFFISLDIISLRQSTVEDLSGLARVIGINCAAPLEFLDSETADEILSSLSVRPYILQAILYTVDGQIFSQYRKPSLSSLEVLKLCEQFEVEDIQLESEFHYFHKTHIDLFVPIGEPGKVIGMVVLQADQGEFYAILTRLIYAVCGITIVTLLLAFFFSSILTKIISRPILALAETTERIRREKNYTLRAEKRSEDELGVLVRGVNSMLDGIEQRDSQLLVAKMAAEDANRAKSQFLAQMSHEIRTPMNGVLGIASLLLNTSLDRKQRQFVHTIRKSGEVLLNLINDILDFSKIEAGRLELELIHFNIREIAEESVDLFSQQAREKDIHLVCFIHSSVPAYIVGDPERLRQILVNLLSNAVKFTRNGEVSLHITKAKMTDNAHLRFEVKDSGVGISPKKQDEIFAAFSQEDLSTTRKFGGTGLGLAISRQLVQMMGGEIGVESTRGKGSTFWFTAIFAIGSSSQSLTKRKHREMEEFNASILVAEDNPTNQIVAQGVLEQLGCRVDLVENGSEAVFAAAHNDYSLIFMDCQMPVMDGYEATAKIRKIEAKASRARIPIIALTAHAMKGDREHCLVVGMDDYLAKPFSEQQLANILSKWLPTGRRRRSSNGNVKREQMGFHIDEIILDNLCQMQKPGKPDIRERLVRIYLRSGQKILEDLKQAVDNNNSEELWKSAHSLKSSSATIGANHLSFLCYNLETLGREGQLEHAKESIWAIRTEFKAVIRGLENIVSSK